MDCFVTVAPKKKQRFEVLISLELSSEVSPHPEERALLSVRLEGWPRGPWFETPRKSAAPHHEVPVWVARFIQPRRPKAGAELAMTGLHTFMASQRDRSTGVGAQALDSFAAATTPLISSGFCVRLSRWNAV
jgi:hypothetical protein